jgi:hypothetical protein
MTNCSISRKVIRSNIWITNKQTNKRTSILFIIYVTNIEMHFLAIYIFCVGELIKMKEERNVAANSERRDARQGQGASLNQPCLPPNNLIWTAQRTSHGTDPHNHPSAIHTQLNLLNATYFQCRTALCHTLYLLLVYIPLVLRALPFSYFMSK